MGWKATQLYRQVRSLVGSLAYTKKSSACPSEATLLGFSIRQLSQSLVEPVHLLSSTMLPIAVSHSSVTGFHASDPRTSEALNKALQSTLIAAVCFQALQASRCTGENQKSLWPIRRQPSSAHSPIKGILYMKTTLLTCLPAPLFHPQGISISFHPPSQPSPNPSPNPPHPPPPRPLHILPILPCTTFRQQHNRSPPFPILPLPHTQAHPHPIPAHKPPHHLPTRPVPNRQRIRQRAAER